MWSESIGSGRAVRGFSRPWPVAVAGASPVFSFDVTARAFTLSYEARPGRTEVFVPSHWFPEGWTARIYPAESGVIVLEERPESQRLYVSGEGEGPVTLIVEPRP